MFFGRKKRVTPPNEETFTEEELRDALRHLREAEFASLEERSRAKEFLYRTRRFLVLGSTGATLYVLARDCPALRAAGLSFKERVPDEVERWVAQTCASALNDADPERSSPFSETDAENWQELPSNARFGAFRFFPDGSFAFERLRFPPEYPLSGCRMGQAVLTRASDTLTIHSPLLGTVNLRFQGTNWYSSRDLSFLVHLGAADPSTMREPSPERPTVMNVRQLFMETAEAPTFDAAAVAGQLRELHFRSWRERCSARAILLSSGSPAMIRPDPKNLLLLDADAGALQRRGFVFSTHVPEDICAAEIELFSGPFGPSLFESLPDDLFEVLWRQGPMEIAVDDSSKRSSLYPRQAREAVLRTLFRWVQALLLNAQPQKFSEVVREDWIGFFSLFLDEMFLDEAQITRCPQFGFENEARVIEHSLRDPAPHPRAIAWLLEAHDAIVFQASTDFSLDVPPENEWLTALRESIQRAPAERPKTPAFATPDDSILPQDDLEMFVATLTREDRLKGIIRLQSQALRHRSREISVETQVKQVRSKEAYSWSQAGSTSHFHITLCTGYVACNLVIVRTLLAIANGMRKPLQFVPMRLIPSDGLVRPTFSWDTLKEASSLSRGYLSRADAGFAWRIAKDLFALQFFHELAHTVADHNGLKKLFEGKDPEIERNLKWAMEVEADHLAVLALFYHGAAEVHRESTESFRERFETIAWALNVAYRLTPLERDPLARESKTHPPWGYRARRVWDREAPAAIRSVAESDRAPRTVDCLGAWKGASDPVYYDHFESAGQLFMQAAGTLEQIPDTSSWGTIEEHLAECENRVSKGLKCITEIRERFHDGP